MPQSVRAYSCAMSPARDAAIIKTDNSRDREATCKVECVFAGQDGPVTISCTQKIPAGAKNWYVCLRPTGGKAYGQLEGGSESCAKPQPRQ